MMRLILVAVFGCGCASSGLEAENARLRQEIEVSNARLTEAQAEAAKDLHACQEVIHDLRRSSQSSEELDQAVIDAVKEN